METEMHESDRERSTPLVQLINRTLSESLKGMRFEPDSADDQEKIDRLKAELLQALSEVIPQKAWIGLIEWAIKSMDQKFFDYFRHALNDYLALSQLYQTGKRSSLRESLEATPFSFPLRIRKNPKVLFSNLDQKYAPVFARVKQIKSSWRDDPPALTHDLGQYAHELLGEKLSPKILEKYITMEPAQVALDLTRRKYRIPLGSEALKKIIAQQNDPMKLARSFVASYRSGRKSQ